MDIDAYLERIKYRGPLDVNARTLHDLHSAHLMTVPFENLSIHAGEPIVLEEEALFDKIVHRRRGGFCYELNGLFAALLRTLGFDVSMLSARVAQEDGGWTPEFDHMTLIVKLEQVWLADVGFGDFMRYPLALDDVSATQTQAGREYQLSVSEEFLTVLEKKPDKDWEAQYRFKRKPYAFADFVPRCHYHQTSLDSHFRRGRVCSRATLEGRLTLSEMTFIMTTTEGDRKERLLGDAEEVGQILREEFGVVL